MKIDMGMSDNSTITIIDDDGSYYEYHKDTNRVLIFNRYEDDEGEFIVGKKAKKIKEYALK